MAAAVPQLFLISSLGETDGARSDGPPPDSVKPPAQSRPALSSPYSYPHTELLQAFRTLVTLRSGVGTHLALGLHRFIFEIWVHLYGQHSTALIKAALLCC